MERRYAEVDAWKATAILTVVAIHSFRSPFDPSISDAEVWLGHLTRFAVPAFLLASGFLYAGAANAGRAVTLRRLRRILVPYAIASLVVIAWSLQQGLPPESESFLADLLFGAAVGPYYYVFIVVGLVLVTPGFARLAGPRMAALTAALVAIQWWSDAATPFFSSFFWALRNPLLWWAYFAVGWLLRLHHAAAVAWIAPRRATLVAVLAAVVVALSVASGLAGPRLAVRSAAWLEVYAVCALIFVASAGRDRVSPAMRYLSDASYAIYLVHLLFVRIASAYVPPPPGRLALLPVLVPWVCALVGSIAVIAGLRAVLGRHSRSWIVA